MNKIKLLIMLIIAITINAVDLKAQHNHSGSVSGNSNQNQAVSNNNSQIIKGGNHSFKVDGNCEECKKKIEAAALAIKGVKTANWNISTHILTVNLKARTELEDVYQSVAKAGHDNEKYQTADRTYTALPVCCQYRQ